MINIAFVLGIFIDMVWLICQMGAESTLWPPTIVIKIIPGWHWYKSFKKN